MNRSCNPPLPPPPAPPSEEDSDKNSSTTSLQAKYSKGDKVHVWSNTKKTWLEGIVEEVFTEGGTFKDYSIPAGVIKVEFDAGMKFILPENQDTMVRRAESAGVRKAESAGA